MSNSTRIAERQPTDTSSPMPVDVARDLLAVVRALEARVAVLEDVQAPAVAKAEYMSEIRKLERLWKSAKRLPTVPDAYGR